jgi:putative oxidoreductase
MQQINFLKNVSIAGGMLMVFAYGPGAYSVDRS